MFKGTKITIGEKEFVVPPLSLGQLRSGALALLKQHDELIADKSRFFDAMVTRGEIIALALKRNYPDLNTNELLDSLDMGNTNEIWLAVLGASGFKPGEVIPEAVATTPLPGKTNGALESSTQS